MPINGQDVKDDEGRAEDDCDYTDDVDVEAEEEMKVSECIYRRRISQVV